MGIPFGRYELLRRIAAGGMGEVYLARQAGLEGFEKLLVVKVLLPHLVENEEFTTMFLDEARIAARLNHGNVAQIFDLGEVEGAYYIAMEYIHGDDVKRIWKRAHQQEKPVPLPLAVRIAADAAAGLDYAHKATDSDNEPLGIIHRDVSPQNILVTFEGGVKLIDFGIARAAGRNVHTATGTLKGKYPYMSPEQATSKELDHRSDIFALGVVLYEMATSRRLFARESEIAILRAVADCEVPAPSMANPDIDEQLEGVILKALAPSPELRFSNAQELRLALEDWLVQSRKSGSSAHLAAYLQDLYRDRLSEERARGRPLTEQDHTPSGVVGRSPLGLNARQGTASSHSRSSSRAGAIEEDERLLSTAVLTDKPSKRSPWLPLGAIAGVVVAAAVVLAWHGMGGSGPEAAPGDLSVVTRPPGALVSLDGAMIGTTPLQAHPIPAGSSGLLEIELEGHAPVIRAIAVSGSHDLDVSLEPLAAPVTEPEAPPEEPEPPPEITLLLTSRPAGATVTLEGETLGRTPLDHRMARTGEEVELQFRLAGHRPVRQRITADDDAEVSARLRRMPARQEEPSLDIKIGR